MNIDLKSTGFFYHGLPVTTGPRCSSRQEASGVTLTASFRLAASLQSTADATAVGPPVTTSHPAPSSALAGCCFEVLPDSRAGGMGKLREEN